MKLITLWISEPYLMALDNLVSHGNYPSRAEAIRLAIRDLLVKESCLPKGKMEETE